MTAQFEKSVISFRIGPGQWLSDTRFHELLDLFERNPGVADELTFFTAETHAPLPIEVMEKRANILADRMLQARRLGYRAGINILATIGHHSENISNSLSGDYTHMTGIDGNVCLGSLCPNDENVRDYVERVYKILASANPDYIWLDDDVRLAWHPPVLMGCFCDNCLSIFQHGSGMRFSRESLKEAFNGGAVADKLKVRKAWMEHNRKTLSRLFELIEETVHSLKLGVPLGFMTGDRFFEGYDFDTWAGVLSGPQKAEAMWRPGGGFYTEDRLADLADKSHAIGRQVSVLYESVVSIQSEVENFSYQRLQKSAHVTALEAASHIAAGCTGAAFNVLSFYDEPLDEYQPLVSKLTRTRPFYDLMVRTLGRSEPHGISWHWGKDLYATNNLSEDDWLSYSVGDPTAEVFQLGLPAAYSQSCASVKLLSGDSVAVADDSEIATLLASGIYLDAKALARLNEMGYSELTGFAVEGNIEADAAEELTDHPLNAGFSGRHRDCRQSFWKGPAAVLRPLDVRSETLARLVDYSHSEIAPCCMGLFENQLGGRICVSGYYPWTSLQSLAKSAQMKTIMRWLSKDTLPAFVSSYHKTNMWVRQPDTGGTAIVLTNSYLDMAEDVILSVLTNCDELSVFDMDCRETRVRSTECDGPYRKFTLPVIPPWEMRLVTVK
ncbi:MAG: hypothetical protein ACYC64_08520 [Armatimonadota bacterium]